MGDGREKREKKKNGGGGSSDPLVVMTLDLVPLIDLYVREHEGQHNTNGSAYYDASEQYSALKALEFQTGIVQRVLWAIRSKERRWVSLDIADKLLTGMGMTHMLDNGTVKVVMNPTWGREHYEAWRAANGGCENDWAG